LSLLGLVCLGGSVENAEVAYRLDVRKQGLGIGTLLNCR
jgi:hypothetical protein